MFSPDAVAVATVDEFFVESLMSLDRCVASGLTALSEIPELRGTVSGIGRISRVVTGWSAITASTVLSSASFSAVNGPSASTSGTWVSSVASVSTGTTVP